jgi:hypothetical protein
MSSQYTYVPAFLPILSVVVLVLAALGGVLLAALHLRSRQTLAPLPIALLHGGLGAMGVFLLVFVFVYGGLNMLSSVATALFLVVAIVGIYMFVKFRLKDKPLPTGLVLLHGAVAAGSLVLYLYAVFVVGGMPEPFLTTAPVN